MDKLNDENIILSCSSVCEEDAGLISEVCEQQVEVETYELSMENSRSVEKRQRQESEENKNEDDEFITVQRRPKRVHRSTSDDETYEVCLSSREILPKQIGMAKLLKSQNIKNIVRIKYKGPYKALITFNNKNDAKELLNNQKILELDYKCHPTNEVQITYGVVKDIDLDIEEKEIIEEFQCEAEILAMKRLRRLKENNEWVPSTTIRLTFKSTTLPPYIMGYGYRLKVEPYTFPVSQCSGCWKFGHLVRSCPSKKIKCPKCSQDHQNCDTKEFVCINCKGHHMALDKKCPMFIKEKKIRNIMCLKNITYRKALEFYCEQERNLSETNIREKMHDVIDEQIFINELKDAGTRSYRDVLITGSSEINEHNMPHNDSSDNDLENSTQNLEKSRKKGKKRTRPERMHETVSALEFKDNSKTHKDSANTKDESEIKRLLKNLREIILSKKDLKDKFFDVAWLIMREIGVLFTMFVKGSDVANKILSLFNGGNSM